MMEDLLFELSAFLRAFRFLRPEWLLVVPVVAAGWWVLRRRAGTNPPWADSIAPHLRAALLVGRKGSGSVRPVDLTALMLLFLALAAAGPAWTRMPDPFVTETAPMVVVLELSDRVYATDVQPDRLTRARMKIRDLATLRAGGRTALVAYAGTAHTVLPPTEDPDLIQPFLDGLAPEVLPTPGRDAGAALDVAISLLNGLETPGSIVFVAGGIDAEHVPAFEAASRAPNAPGLAALIIGTETGGPVTLPDGTFATGPDGNRVRAAVDPSELDLLRRAGVTIVRAGLGDADIRAIERRMESALRAAGDAEDDARWQDRGYFLIWPAAILCLFWFRKGWRPHAASWLVAATLLASGQEAAWAQASGERITYADRPDAMVEGSVRQTVTDWFFTRDQQGRFAYERKDYIRAGALFEDPMWKGLALYRAGRYAAAADAFSAVEGAPGLYNRGLAQIRGRDYAGAIGSFEKAAREDPDDDRIRANLEMARRILAYLERVREQSDRRTEHEAGADAVVFDKQAEGGFEMVVSEADRVEFESAEKWMRMVDTRVADFLKTKFAQEAARSVSEGNAQ
ncbi:MAG: VWA domain-containing protein [Pseudomonadota bacterium]